MWDAKARRAATLLCVAMIGVIGTTLSETPARGGISTPVADPPGWRDLAQFREYLYVSGVRPAPESIDRVCEVARGGRADRPVRVFAGVCAVQGWVNDASALLGDLRKLAREEGDLQAMAVYGLELCTADPPVAEDLREGLRLLRASAEAGEPLGACYLGRVYVAGLPGAQADPTKAEPLLKKALDDGCLQALEPLVHLCSRTGRAAPFEEYARRAEVIGDCAVIAQLVEAATPNRLREDQVARVRRGAMFDDANLSYLLARAADHRDGGLDRDAPLSRRLLSRAAAQGHDGAATQLSLALLTGAYDVRPEPARGVATLEQLAKRGTVPAQFELGRILAEGLYQVPRDVAGGRQLIRRAGEAGHPGATTYLAAPAPKEVGSDGNRMPMATTRDAAGTLPRPDATVPAPGGEVDLQFQSDAMAVHQYVLGGALRPGNDQLRRLVQEHRRHPQDPEATYLVAQAGMEGWIRVDDATLLFKQAADRGYPPAKAFLGAALAAGDRVEQDVERGFGLMREAAERGDPRGHFLWGRALAAGAPGVPPNYEAAEPHLREAAKGGMSRALQLLSRLYRLTGKLGQSSEYLIKAAEAGEPEAMMQLFQFYSARDAAEDVARAVHWAARGALWGDPGLMCVYAQLLDKEFGGLAEDPPLSRFLLHRAAALGDRLAAILLEEGRVTGRFEVAIDRDAGLNALRSAAAERNDVDAKYSLGILLYRGEHVPGDVQAGLRLIHDAANGGQATAKKFMGDHVGEIRK